MRIAYTAERKKWCVMAQGIPMLYVDDVEIDAPATSRGAWLVVDEMAGVSMDLSQELIRIRRTAAPPGVENDLAMRDWWIQSKGESWLITGGDDGTSVVTARSARIDCRLRSFGATLIGRAELLVDGATVRTGHVKDAKQATLRTLRVFNQEVQAKVMGVRSVATAPR